MKQDKIRTSIKQKIVFGYFFILASIVSLSIFTLVELNFLDQRIIFAETISTFFDTALEIRRFEKNYFLYHQRDDYRENVRYVDQALELLAANSHKFRSIAPPQRIEDLVGDLGSYKEFMYLYAYPDAPMEERLLFKTKEAPDVPGSPSNHLEEKIRETGKKILSVAEEMSKETQRNLQKILNDSQTILIVSILLLSLIGLAIGQILSRMIVRPLTQLENSMAVIAGGRFERITIDSNDREIVSLTDAFNKMLRELEVRQRYLVQSEKLASLGTLLSGVAHELNNPLSNISTSSQILSEEIEDTDMEFKKELLSQIEEQTERAKKIVRSLLEFSRDKEFKKESLPLKALLEETLRFLKGQVPTGVLISLDVAEDMTVLADKQRIQQVFLNLIKNAVEAMGDQGTVSITAQKYSAGRIREAFGPGLHVYGKFAEDCATEEETVIIIIADTGPGIPEEVLPKIFDPFFTTKEVGKGAGLGLSIVHEIIEEHHGCIGVDSKAGKGTTFLIRLPVKEK